MLVTNLPMPRTALAILALFALDLQAATRHVWLESPNPSPPYTNWATAAHLLQDAADVALPGDTVLVTNGVYSLGGRSVAGALTNRVVIPQAITLLSVNGPEVTVIEGAPAPVGGDAHGNGEGAIRCVTLGADAVLSGFTLTNGHTRIGGDYLSERTGGGVWSEPSGLITNCVLAGNAAGAGGGASYGALAKCTLIGNTADHGGGAYLCRLTNCTLTANSAVSDGGGAAGGTLQDCELTGNSAYSGGGAQQASLYNCRAAGNSASFAGGGAQECTLHNSTLTGNSAEEGGGAFYSTLHNCTLTGNSASQEGGGVRGGILYNCIVYYNAAPMGENHSVATFSYSCTTPLPPGTGNLPDDPLLASATHLSVPSPCIGRGSATYARGVDIDGQPWRNPPSMGADQLVPGGATGGLAVSIGSSYSLVTPGFAVPLAARIEGQTTRSAWSFGDSTGLTNQPYASHAWSEPGFYELRLTAYNDSFPSGISATALVQVVSPQCHYVNQANPTPAFPYISWETAALTIQEAIDAGMLPGRLVLVTNGVYATGGAVVDGGLTNRVALTRSVRVLSVNGPEATIIAGHGPLGDSAVRCAYVGEHSLLGGFTLTNGHTRFKGNSTDQNGGAAWCDVLGVVSNCVLAGSSAYYSGGGSYGGILHGSHLTGNLAVYGGGGANGQFCNCLVTGNRAGQDGGGAYLAVLHNCTVIGNWAQNGGGAAQTTILNCIVQANTAMVGPNHLDSDLRFSSTFPLPAYGQGNITNQPVFIQSAAGDFHLRYGSPGIDAGTDLGALLTHDLDGLPRPLDGDGDGSAAFDMGAFEFDLRTVVPPEWFIQYGLDPADPYLLSGNPDHDHLTTFQEWQADTDPTDAQSFFRIDDFRTQASGAALVYFQSSSNRFYSLFHAPDLNRPHGTNTVWTSVPGQTGIQGTGGIATLSDTNGATRRFFRVVVDTQP